MPPTVFTDSKVAYTRRLPLANVVVRLTGVIENGDQQRGAATFLSPQTDSRSRLESGDRNVAAPRWWSGLSRSLISQSTSLRRTRKLRMT